MSNGFKIPVIPKYEEGKKYLVIAGCSFTAPPNQWPERTDIKDLGKELIWNSWGEQTADVLDMVCINSGISGVGNNMIMRQLLYTLHRMFEMGYPKESIIASVMWSGCDRTEIFMNDGEEKIVPERGAPVRPRKNILGSNGYWISFNPSTVGYMEQQMNSDAPLVNFPESCRKYIEIGNHIYFRTWASEVQRILYSLQCVLTTQEFLKNKGIKYCFQRYTADCFMEETFDYTNPELSWIDSFIDWDKFIEGGEFEWCYDNTEGPFVEETRLGWKREDRKKEPMHPTVKQHQKYAEEVVVPFIKKL